MPGRVDEGFQQQRTAAVALLAIRADPRRERPSAFEARLRQSSSGRIRNRLSATTRCNCFHRSAASQPIPYPRAASADAIARRQHRNPPRRFQQAQRLRSPRLPQAAQGIAKSENFTYPATDCAAAARQFREHQLLNTGRARSAVERCEKLALLVHAA